MILNKLESESAPLGQRLGQNARRNNNGGPAHLANQDKRVQELRAFALEYVKHIVAKANELSQERQEARNAQRLAQFYSGASLPAARRAPVEGPAPHNAGQLREAARQINQRFQLCPASEAAGQRPTSGCRETSRAEEARAAEREHARKRGEPHKLNWSHLLACFSTCLPRTLAEASPFPSGGPRTPAK